MKILGATAFLIVIALCKAEYSVKQNEKLEESSVKCIEDLELAKDSDIGKKFRYGELKEKDDVAKKFITCAMQKLNFMNEEGLILEDRIVEFLADNYEETMAKDVIEKCAKVQKETVAEKATAFYDCFFLRKSFDI
ncbi:uncharacterized protein LOC115255059 [Aedes albopictus]|uniref:Uncharacterized protein n=1 Tax=Aedes albopictus TaxID=7160 RepID=A0ABM1ZPP5_AEDAL|nr:uncharacterized protein LOC109407496 [Aedes albopictus]XP_029708678.1 uncharacterized protein LOC115255059 [Aedes albopictus]